MQSGRKLRIKQRTIPPVEILQKFESSEHDQIYNFIIESLTTDNGKQYILMPNEIDLTFSDIIALAGDYYAIPDKPISDGITEKEQRKRFMKAFSTLAHADRAEVKRLLAIMDEQLERIKNAMEAGKTEEEAVAAFAVKELACATYVTNGRFLNISIKNLDHFGEDAKTAHRIGHKLAIEQALVAREATDPATKASALGKAYALEAFACHFLTDSFASGHMRTPRRALDKQFGHVIGAILALFMHKEDNQLGLEVRNEAGNEWKAYGDGNLFENKSADARDIIRQAIKAALDEVHDAFAQGKKLKGDSAAYKYFPKINVGKPQTFPLFVNNPQDITIENRKNLSDPFADSGREELSCFRVPIVIFHLLTSNPVATPAQIPHVQPQQAVKKSSGFFGLFSSKKEKKEIKEQSPVLINKNPIT